MNTTDVFSLVFVLGLSGTCRRTCSYSGWQASENCTWVN